MKKKITKSILVLNVSKLAAILHTSAHKVLVARIYANR